jgi:GNAT superfamily N-acetyltransferase
VAEIRPMTTPDSQAAVQTTWLAMESMIPAEFLPDPATRIRRGLLRNEHVLATDPGGSFVADAGGAIIGVGMAIMREGVWILSQLAVHPEHQARQIGRRLLDATLQYGGDAVRGRLIASSSDPRAMRRYRRAGLDLVPCVGAAGALAARAIPTGLRSRAAVLPDDQDLCDRVSRHVRNAAHGPDVAALCESHGRRLLVHDSGGWAIARDGSPVILAAIDDRIARDLLWSVFASGPRGASVHVDHLSRDQQWAIDVCLDAGLTLSPGDPLYAAGDLGPLAPFLPSGIDL